MLCKHEGEKLRKKRPRTPEQRKRQERKKQERKREIEKRERVKAYAVWSGYIREGVRPCDL